MFHLVSLFDESAFPYPSLFIGLTIICECQLQVLNISRCACLGGPSSNLAAPSNRPRALTLRKARMHHLRSHCVLAVPRILCSISGQIRLSFFQKGQGRSSKSAILHYGHLPWLPDASTTSATVLGPTALSCPDRIVGLLAAQSEPCAHFFWHLSVRSRLLVFESCASCGDSALRVTTMGGVKVCSRTPEFECCSLIKVLCVLKIILF